MPGIGSSMSQAAKAVGEVVIKPTVDTLQTATTEGVVEPILGTGPKSQPADPSPNQPQPTSNTTNSPYNPRQRQNVINFLNAAAAQEQQSKSRHQAEANAKQQQEAEAKKQTEIKQIEIKKAKRAQILNRAVFDKQRGIEIKKGGV